MALDAEWVRRWLADAAEEFIRERARLSELDREIGDGDHGENLVRGFNAVHSRIGAASEELTPAELLELAASELRSSVGGASGPLYAAGFSGAASVLGPLESPGAAAIVAAFGAARDSIMRLGRAIPGDKTMVDAWTPALRSAETVLHAGGSVLDVLEAAAAGARAGAEATEAMLARKGRASYLGERSLGHRDPGSVSTAILLEAAARTARESAS